MADKFVLTAQLQLQAPTNVNQVLNQVRSQLASGNTTIQANVQTTGMAQANKQMQNLSKSAQSASTSMKSADTAAGSLVKTLGAAARRFAAITVATGTFLAIARSIGEATRKAIEFETEMIKISQVTGKSLKSLQGLNKEVTKIATSMGVSSQEILGASRTLLQAGFSADKVRKSLVLLAQTDLAATFDSIQDSTEGAIALLRQFRNEAQRAGGDVKFLEQSLNAINAVSKNFAVESADLITVIRKTGGVFEAAGGSLNELLALFTSVRATTRESADTIATGFRTIFTRIQRTETIEQLKELGIVLQDSTGKFVGPLEAIRRLQAGLAGLDPRDYRFNEIVEQLGGFRQIGKVIPLLKQYGTTAEALAIANAAAGENAADAAKAQQGLGNQVTKLKEKFDALVRTFIDSKTFKSLAAGALSLAEAFIRIAESLEPLLPMLTTLASLKLGQMVLPSIGKFAMGGGPRGFNKGGLVPGQGNFDTVPAMLTPGEFVMRKSAVKNIGASSMASMNARGYAAGGKVSGTRNFYGIKEPYTPNPATFGNAVTKSTGVSTGSIVNSQESEERIAAQKLVQSAKVNFRMGANERPGGFSLLKRSVSSYPAGNSPLGSFSYGRLTNTAKKGLQNAIQQQSGEELPEIQRLLKGRSFTSQLADDQTFPTASFNEESGLRQAAQDGVSAGVKKGLGTAIDRAFNDADVQKALGVLELGGAKTGLADAKKRLQADTAARSSGEGYVFEGLVDAFTGAVPSSGQESFDLLPSEFAAGEAGLKTVFGPLVDSMFMAELKRDPSKFNKIGNKYKNYVQGGSGSLKDAGLTYSSVEFFNRGGAAKGSDTVPAMLTPGEFVINKKSASGIGYSNLQRMNQSGGIQGYAAGGIVNARRNNYGMFSRGGGGGASLGSIPGISSVSKGFTTLAQQIGAFVGQLIRSGETVLASSTAFSEAMTAAVTGAQALATLDDRILQSINTAPLVQGFTDAGAGLKTLDNKLLTAVTAAAVPLEAAFSEVAKIVVRAPASLISGVESAAAVLKKGAGQFIEAATGSVAPLKKAMQNASAGITKVDDVLLQVTRDAVAPLDGAMQSTAGGISSIDKMLRGSIAEGVAPLKEAFKGQNIQQPLKDFIATVVKVDKQFEGIIKLIAGIETPLKDLGVSLLNLNRGVDGLVTQLNTAVNSTAQINKTTQAHVQSQNQLIVEEKKETQQLAASNPSPGTGPVGGAVMGGGGGGGMMANNMMMLAMSVSMVTSELSGLDEPIKKAINSFAMTSMVGLMLAQVLGDMVNSGYQSVAAKRAEAKAALQNAAAKKTNSVSTNTNTVSSKGNTVSNNVNTTSKTANSAATNLNSTSQVKGGLFGFTGGTAGGRAAAGAGPSMMAGAAIYAAFQSGSAYFAEKAKEALEESTESFEKALELSAEGDDAGSAGALARSISQGRDALANESLASGLSATGIGAGLGAAIGGVLGSVIPGFGTALGIAAGAAIGGAIGSAFGDWSSSIEGQALENLANSAYNLSVGMQKMDAAILQIQEGGFDAATSMEMLRAGTEEYRKFQAEAAKAQAKYNQLIQDEEAKGDLADSESITKWTEMEAEAREQAAQKAMDYARMERETRDALIDDLAAQGGDIEGIFNNPQIQAARQAYIQYLVDSGKLTVEQATKVANEVDTNKKKEIQAARDARKAAQEAAAARLAEIRLIKEHNQLMLTLNQALGALAGAGENLTITQGILNNEFKKMPTTISNSLTTTLSNFNAAGLDEYGAALESATADAPQRVRDAANKSQFYKKLFTQAESQLEGLVGDSGQLSADQSLTEEGARSENVQKKFNDSFASILDSLPPSVRKQVDANLKKAAKDGVIDPDEFTEILKPIEEAGKRGAEAAIKWVKIQQEYAQRYLDVSNALIAQIQKENDARAYAIEVEERGRKRLEEATGKKPDRFAAENARRNAARARLGANAGLVGDVEGLKNVVIRNTKTVLANKDALDATTKKYDKAGKVIGETRDLSVEDQKRVAIENVKLAQESANATAELKRLADQSERASDVMAEIELERSKRETISGAIKEFTFASNEGRAEINKSYFALSRVLQTGNLNSIPDEMRGAVGGLLDDFADIEIFGGMTGADISKQLQVQTMDQQLRMVRGRGLTDDEKKRIYESTPKEDQLIDELRAINAEEKAAADALAQIEKENTETMKKLLTGIETLLGALKARIDEGSLTLASGGLVAYKAGGGSIFKPRGTDTVPAMLTPGEFVIKKSAVNKVGVGALSAINNGGSPVYKAEGGLVGGSDAIRMTARNMGIAKIRELYGMEGAKAFKDNDVAALIEASGQEKSPFGQMSKVLDVMAQYTDMFSSMSAEGIALKPGMQDRFNQMIVAMEAAMPDGVGGLESLRQYNPGFFAGILALNQISAKLGSGENAPSVEGQFGATASAASGNKLTKEEARKNRAKLFKEKREKDMQANAKFRTEKANEVYRDRLMNTPDETGMSPNERIARRAQAEKDAIQKEKLRAEGLATHNFSSNASESDIALMKKYGQYKSWEAMAAQVKARMDEKRETAQSFDQRYSGDIRSDEQKAADDAALAERRENRKYRDEIDAAGDISSGGGTAKQRGLAEAQNYQRNYNPVLDSKVMAEIDKFVSFVSGNPWQHGESSTQMETMNGEGSFRHPGAFELVHGYFKNRMGGLWGSSKLTTQVSSGGGASYNATKLRKSPIADDSNNPQYFPVSLPIGEFYDGYGAAVYTSADTNNFSGDHLIAEYLKALENGHLKDFSVGGMKGSVGLTPWLKEAYEGWKGMKTDAGQAKDVAAVEEEAYKSRAARISQDKGKPMRWGLISALGLSDRETDLVDEHQHLFDRINYAINSGQSIKPEDLERNYSSFQRTGFADSYRRDHIEAAKAYLKYIDARESVGFAREKRAEENDQKRLRQRIDQGTNRVDKDGNTLGYLGSHDPFETGELENHAVKFEEAKQLWQKRVEEEIRPRSQALSNSLPALFPYISDHIAAYTDWHDSTPIEERDKLLFSDYPYNKAFRDQNTEAVAAARESAVNLNYGGWRNAARKIRSDVGVYEQLNTQRAKIMDKKKDNQQYAQDSFAHHWANDFAIGAEREAKRYATGGAVDTVPAMLTPGEFVMNNSAVSKYGTGFMKALNQGRVQGFNKGGVVYAANGSQGGVSGGSGVDNIMGGNSDQLERIAQTFALVMKAFTSVASIFGNMSMTHQVNFGGSIKIDFPNADMISASIAQGAAAQISQMVDEKIESAIENLQNGPG